MTPSDLPSTWRTRAEELEPYAPAAAEAFRRAASELEEATREAASEALTLAQAAKASGYAPRTLREKLASGELPNAGRKHAPRIRRGDLPMRGKACGAGWDADEHVRSIVGGGR